MRVGGIAWLVCVAAVVALATAAPRAQAVATPLPHVTVIGDSVLTDVLWNAQPLAILERGLDVDMEVGICRKLTGVSCPFDGQTVPTLTDLVAQMGPRLGPTVLVEVGYNDDEDTFAQEVETSIDALLAAGVKRILWANMHIWEQQYIPMNAELAAAAKQHPQLTIVDWAADSDNQYSWFQGDGIHLLYPGAVAMATLFNGAIREAVAPPVTITDASLPLAQVGHPYRVRLVAQGGSGTYRWRSVGGPLPAGLRLLANGTVSGRPRHPGAVKLTLTATDSEGHAATWRGRLIVQRTRVAS